MRLDAFAKHFRDIRRMPGDLASKDQIERVRAVLLETDWTESDAWIRIWELPDTFPVTLAQDTPTFASMPTEEEAELFRELQYILEEG